MLYRILPPVHNYDTSCMLLVWRSNHSEGRLKKNLIESKETLNERYSWLCNVLYACVGGHIYLSAHLLWENVSRSTFNAVYIYSYELNWSLIWYMVNERSTVDRETFIKQKNILLSARRNHRIGMLYFETFWQNYVIRY